MLKITKGYLSAPAKITLYGVEGIGKTTLASQFPAALILDVEDGSKRIDCNRYKCADWQALMVAVRSLAVDRQGFGTAVVDSIDWAERLCRTWLCEQHRKKSIEDWAYGKGFNLLAEVFAEFLDACDKLIAAGMNVVLVAHSKVVRTSPPDQTEGFDRWELDLHKLTASQAKEWADAVLFLNYKMRVIEGSDGRAKAIGGKDRVIYAERTAAFDAKNRFGLPAEMPMSIDALAAIFAAGGAPAPAPAKAGWLERVAAATSLNELERIADDAAQAEQAGELTPERARRLDAEIARRQNELDTAEVDAEAVMEGQP